MDVTFKRFSGSVPRMAPHLLGGDTAAVALDCKLWHGRLESWREPLAVRALAATVGTVFQYACCWIEFEGCVDVAQGPTTCRKLFTTGDMPWPAVMEVDTNSCTVTKRRLGIPCAYGAPSVMLGAATASRNVEGRSYAYQYVNDDGEKGALSQASDAQLVHDGQQVIISGWEVPDPSWGVTKVRIYRTVSTHQMGREPGNVLDTTWMFVGEAPINAASFTDTVWNIDLLTALEEDIATPPPAGLRGMIHIDSMNVLAGFVGNRLWFTENNSYHHWPYYLDLDDNICALTESNGMIYVATDGAPYAVTGAVDCKNAGCREAVKLPTRLPMVGCGNRRMAALPQGAVYPSHDGLVALSGNSMPALITHPLYAPDDWQALEPSTVTPVVHGGKLFVFARGGSFVVQVPNGPESGWQLDLHSTLSDRNVRDAFVSRNGDLFLHKPSGVFQWDRGSALRPHLWRSPEIVSPLPVNFAAAHLYHQNGSESVKIVAEGKTVLDREVLSAKVFRLPMWGFGSRWQIELTGTSSVSLFSIASSMRELGA